MFTTRFYDEENPSYAVEILVTSKEKTRLKFDNLTLELTQIPSVFKKIYYEKQAKAKARDLNRICKV
jgi:hypothetical protein